MDKGDHGRRPSSPGFNRESAVKANDKPLSFPRSYETKLLVSAFRKIFAQIVSSVDVFSTRSHRKKKYIETGYVPMYAPMRTGEIIQLIRHANFVPCDARSHVEGEFYFISSRQSSDESQINLPLISNK